MPSLVHWLQDSDELPTIAEAHRRMLTEGRLSKVHYPSPDHLVQRIPVPH